MDLLILNGVSVGKLVSVGWSETTLQSDESGQDLAGNTNVDVIARKITLPCTCGLLRWSEISVILKALDSKAIGGSNIDVTYPDARQGIFATKECRVSDRTTPSTVLIDNEIYWDGLSFTLTEL